MSSFLKSIPLLALLAAAGSAQYAPGDYLVPDGTPSLNMPGLLWRITPGGKLSTAAILPFRFRAELAMPAPDNRSVWIWGWAMTSQQALLVQVAPDGSTTSVQTVPYRSHFKTVMDGDGSLLLFRSTPPHVLRFFSGSFTTVANTLGLSVMTSGSIDFGTGDLIVSSESRFLRLTTRPGMPPITTLAAPRPPGWSCWAPRRDPDTGGIMFCGSNGLHRLDPAWPSTLIPVFPRPGPETLFALDRDPLSGEFVMVGGTNTSPYVHRVFRCHPVSRVFTTLATLPVPNRPEAGAFTVVVAGSRHLAGLNPARPGQPWRLRVSSPGEPGARYAVGLSFGFLPGMPVGGGRRIPLNPDPLFQLSQMGGGIFQGFHGTLDSGGEAVATVAVPNLAPLRGLRVFAAAVTVVAGRFSVISEPVAVTIR